MFNQHCTNHNGDIGYQIYKMFNPDMTNTIVSNPRTLKDLKKLLTPRNKELIIGYNGGKFISHDDAINKMKAGGFSRYDITFRGNIIFDAEYSANPEKDKLLPAF